MTKYLRSMAMAWHSNGVIWGGDREWGEKCKTARRGLALGRNDLSLCRVYLIEPPGREDARERRPEGGG